MSIRERKKILITRHINFGDKSLKGASENSNNIVSAFVFALRNWAKTDAEKKSFERFHY